MFFLKRLEKRALPIGIIGMFIVEVGIVCFPFCEISFFGSHSYTLLDAVQESEYSLAMMIVLFGPVAIAYLYSLVFNKTAALLSVAHMIYYMYVTISEVNGDRQSLQWGWYITILGYVAAWCGVYQEDANQKLAPYIFTKKYLTKLVAKGKVLDIYEGCSPKKYTGGGQHASPNVSGYALFSCPNCKKRLRVPAGKGRIQLTCPICKTKFIVND